MIARPPRTVPVPDAVALLAGHQLPPHVQRAVGEAAEAGRLYAACRGPQYAEARQMLEARICRANRVLAAHNSGLTFGWGDIPGQQRQENR